uniref:CKLF like MARVEL transmembrane domain containing 5 n=1 Tax=Podarcis muralis TaxID=64176 RepID=A0A670K4D5_PODMU
MKVRHIWECTSHFSFCLPLAPFLQGLCFLVFLLLTASISAYMGAALLEVLVTLAFLGLRATHYYERLTRVNWPCLDFLRCISAAIVFTVVAFAVIAASHEGSAVSAFVFSLILIAVFCFDAYKTYRAEMGADQGEWRRGEGAAKGWVQWWHG